MLVARGGCHAWGGATLPTRVAAALRLRALDRLQHTLTPPTTAAVASAATAAAIGDAVRLGLLARYLRSTRLADERIVQVRQALHVVQLAHLPY